MVWNTGVSFFLGWRSRGWGLREYGFLCQNYVFHWKVVEMPWVEITELPWVPVVPKAQPMLHKLNTFRLKSNLKWPQLTYFHQKPLTVKNCCLKSESPGKRTEVREVGRVWRHKTFLAFQWLHYHQNEPYSWAKTMKTVVLQGGIKLLWNSQFSGSGCYFFISYFNDMGLGWV